jgi:hypothetical protein
VTVIIKVISTEKCGTLPITIPPEYTMESKTKATSSRLVLIALLAILAGGLVAGCGGGLADLPGIPSPPASYTVGGTVTGLSGSGLVVSDGTDSITISKNGSFNFPTAVMSGETYYASVGTQPSSPTQNCVVTNGNGTVGSANVTAISIACTTSTFNITGTVAGLTGSGLVLENSGGDDLQILGNGPFAFTTPVASGAAYAVTVRTAPVNPAQICTVTNGSGTVGASDVTGVTVTCTAATVDACTPGLNICSWSGTVSFTNGAVQGSGSVTWSYLVGSATAPGFAPSSGTIKLQATDPACSVSPSSFTLPSGTPASNPSHLTLSYAGGAAVYIGLGISGDPVTVSCPNLTDAQLVEYFAAPLVFPVSSDGKTIEGSYSDSNGSWNWSFTGH